MSNGIESYRKLYDLTDRVVVVVGSGPGMGLESIRAAAEYGARVVCADLDPDVAKAAAAEVDGTAWWGDVTDAAEVERLRDAALALGRLDAVVDIVGGSAPQSPDEVGLETFRRMMVLNAESAYLIGRVFGPALGTQGGGSLVFWASAIAYTSASDMLAYGASKAALVNMVKTFAEEYGSRGVRVNAVAPSTILTPRMEARWDAETTERIGRASILKRMGWPYEVAATAIFLLSDAASYITGQVVTVDGGASVRNLWSGS